MVTGARLIDAKRTVRGENRRVRYLREDLDPRARTRRRKSTSDDGTAHPGNDR